MNVSLYERLDIIRVNMERCRWLNNDLPQEFLLVNIADYTLYLIREREVDYTCRVVVGKQYHKTPVFTYSERKSIGSETTFEHDTIDVKHINDLLGGIVAKLSFQMRKEQWLTSCVVILSGRIGGADFLSFNFSVTFKRVIPKCQSSTN